MLPDYPTPRDAGIRIPPHLMADRFTAGFDHALKGGHLDHVEYFRRSFRLGFRAAKLYLRQVRRRRGVINFPARYRLRLSAHWPDHWDADKPVLAAVPSRTKRPYNRGALDGPSAWSER